jgi:drug/metabolite transporter (DMT)-like permease
MKYIDVSRAALLNQLSTIFIFVLAIVFLKEPVTPRRVGAILLALIGALCVVYPAWVLYLLPGLATTPL